MKSKGRAMDPLDLKKLPSTNSSLLKRALTKLRNFELRDIGGVRDGSRIQEIFWHINVVLIVAMVIGAVLYVAMSESRANELSVMQVQASNCVQVANNPASATEQVIGGAVGGMAGSVASSLIFGSDKYGIGAMLGGAAGAGVVSGTTTYQCRLALLDENGKSHTTTTVRESKSFGTHVRVMKTETGLEVF